jgi:hypothetical protein
MFRFNDDAGPAGSVSSYSPAPQFSDASSSTPAPSRRGRVRSADFGMPERQGGSSGSAPSPSAGRRRSAGRRPTAWTSTPRC